MLKFRDTLKFVIALMMAAGICCSIPIIDEGYQMYQEAVAEISLEDKAASIREKEQFTSYEELPTTYVEAVIAVEDKRFFNHPGVDLLATGRALIHDIQAGSFVEGGSTITQQLAKNLYFSQKKELPRKIAEVFLVMDLEKNFTKQEILELYVNTINYGDGNYCIKDATACYFDKLPKDMNDYECTLLAGVPNAPARYAPTVNLPLARKRQQQVLKRMVVCGYITPESATETAAAGDVQIQLLAN